MRKEEPVSAGLKQLAEVINREFSNLKLFYKMNKGNEVSPQSNKC